MGRPSKDEIFPLEHPVYEESEIVVREDGQKRFEKAVDIALHTPAKHRPAPRVIRGVKGG